MSEKVISLLKGIRTSLQVTAEPVDLLARWMNGKKGYPPLWVRQRVGSLNDFEGSGGEYIAYLKLLCNLKPGDKVLDIGCGCGLMCLQVNENTSLPDYLGPRGGYTGLDIDEASLNWCKGNIESKYPTCNFTNSQEDLCGCQFNVILAKSLFTHLLPSEIIDFLKLVLNLTKPEGVCLSTWFLLNGTEPKGRYTFRWNSYPESYERLTNKKAAVAYQEKWLFDLFKTLGFSHYEVYYGSWRGNNKGLSFQDIIILRR